MLYFVVFIVLFVAAIWLSNHSNYGDWKMDAGIISAIILGLYLLVGGGVALVNQTVEFPQFKANYDQVVVLLRTIKPEAAEDLVGQVADINKELARAKVLNKYYFLDPYISDKFETLEPIVLPSQLVGR